MKTLFWITLGLIVLIGVAMISAGIVSVLDTDDELGVAVDKKELNEAVDETVDETREAVDKVAESVSEGLEEASDRLREATDDDANDHEADDAEPHETPVSKDTPDEEDEGTSDKAEAVDVSNDRQRPNDV